MSNYGAPDGVDLSVGNYDPSLKFEDFDIYEGSVFETLSRVDEKHDLFVSKNLYNMADIDCNLAYCDTDSAYIEIELPFDKTEDIKRTVEYVRNLSFRLNGAYLKALDLYLGRVGNWDPEYNTMDFKSEVIAFRGFLAAKKHYGLGKIWDEGEFFDELKVKKTGGQLVKADITKCTKELLTEVYKILTITLEVTDIRKIYYYIFKTLKSKYTLKLVKAVKDMDYHYFSIPKKWSIKELKKEGHPVIGSRFYNRLFENRFGPGDSVLLLQVHHDVKKIREEFKKNPVKGNNMLPDNRLSEFNRIAIPPYWRNKEEADNFINRFNEIGLEPDLDSIIEFNISSKLEPYKALFPKDVIKGIE